jgi:hypothetical protein
MTVSDLTKIHPMPAPIASVQEQLPGKRLLQPTEALEITTFYPLQQSKAARAGQCEGSGLLDNGL